MRKVELLEPVRVSKLQFPMYEVNILAKQTGYTEVRLPHPTITVCTLRFFIFTKAHICDFSHSDLFYIAAQYRQLRRKTM